MGSESYQPAHDGIGDDSATWLGRQDGADIAAYFAARQRIEHVEPGENETEPHR